jgi:hypothetical protein
MRGGSACLSEEEGLGEYEEDSLGQVLYKGGWMDRSMDR